MVERGTGQPVTASSPTADLLSLKGYDVRKSILIAPLLLAACGEPMVPVTKPCGVIEDPLGDVQATTTAGNQRIDEHFEAGVRAGCWDRTSAQKR